MAQNFLIQLTNKIYKLTLLFPKKEPLRYKMREVADNILANQTIKDLEILDNFFEVAKEQNWLKSEDLLNLQNDYSKLKEDLEKSKLEENVGTVEVRPQQFQEPQQPQEQPQQRQNEKPEVAKSQAPVRQDKILEILKEKGRAQVGDMKKIFSEVTKRTLRRDFKDLLKKGTIERLGERNETFYRIKQGIH
ncbi:DeoR family transcriptional regulator [Patescibacteria group bacterium]|nr:DeoR family transcriptional regulator [Patescibacteria group bacterium]